MFPSTVPIYFIQSALEGRYFYYKYDQELNEI